MATIIKTVNADWTDIKNECRSTVNKQETSVEPTQQFITKLLISEHSPIRLVNIKWRWENIKSWISVHFARHHIGVEKWISTQRSDRTGIDRDKSPQDTPVNMDMVANAQALINMGRFRLCYQAHKETRAYMEDLKNEIEKVQPELANVMIPNCVYRHGCSEFTSCGLWNRFAEYMRKNDIKSDDIAARYDAYDKFCKGGE